METRTVSSNIVKVLCPDCGHARSTNRNGRCRCGSYLVMHYKPGEGVAVPVDKKAVSFRPTRAWLLDGNCWKLLVKGDGPDGPIQLTATGTGGEIEWL